MLRFASFRRLLLLPALLLLLAPAVSFGQNQPAPFESVVEEIDLPPPAAAPVDPGPGLDQLSRRLFLPALRVGPSVTVTFGTGFNSATGDLTGIATSFAAGIDQIFVQARVDGGSGLTLRRDFVFADGDVLTGSDRSVTSESFRSTSSYCITTAFTCSSGRIVLPRGVYTARIYLNNVLFRQVSVPIN